MTFPQQQLGPQGPGNLAAQIPQELTLFLTPPNVEVSNGAGDPRAALFAHALGPRAAIKSPFFAPKTAQEFFHGHWLQALMSSPTSVGSWMPEGTCRPAHGPPQDPRPQLRQTRAPFT